MPPPSNTEAPPLPPSTSTEAGAEAANNALDAARKAVEAASSTPGPGITPEGSGSMVGTTFAPEVRSDTPEVNSKTTGTGLIPKVDEPTIPASTPFTEAVASHVAVPAPDTNQAAEAASTDTPAIHEPSAVAQVVSPLDELPPSNTPEITTPSVETNGIPPAEDVKIKIDSPQPVLPHYADAAPGSDNPNNATAAEALAATPEASNQEIFPGANQELRSKYDKQISEANQEYLAATNPQAKLEALIKLEFAARLAQTPVQQELQI